MKTVEAMQLIQLLERCESLGADPVALRQSVGLTPAQLAAPDGRLPWETVSRILSQAERDTGDSLFALRAGRLRPPRGLLIYQFRSQSTLKEALAQLARNIHLAADPVRLEVRVGTRQARLVAAVDDGGAESSAAIREYLTGQIVCFIEAVVPEFRPLRVSFPHAPRGPLAEYERLLGAPVRFREADCEIAISPSSLALPIPSANLTVARMLAERIERRLVVLRGPSFRARVEAALEELLRDQPLATDRTHAARRLGVSARTLQRRLAADGATFRAVREGVLQRSATSFLARPSITFTEVARRIGFADEDAFAKAWKRWTGMTPSESRRSGGPSED
jgi:AraC-like DNA-binding protein